MSPLVILTLFGFMFVIVLCLTLWAALTLGGSRRRPAAAIEEEAYPTAPLGKLPVWRSDAAPEFEVSARRQNLGRTITFEATGAPRPAQPETRLGAPAEKRAPVREIRVVETEPARQRAEGSARAAEPRSVELPQPLSKPAPAEPASQAAGPAAPDQAAARRGADKPVTNEGVRRLTNDDFRRVGNDAASGNKATVTPRKSGDAFERFLENDRKDRGF